MSVALTSFLIRQRSPLGWCSIKARAILELPGTRTVRKYCFCQSIVETVSNLTHRRTTRAETSLIYLRAMAYLPEASTVEDKAKEPSLTVAFCTATEHNPSNNTVAFHLLTSPDSNPSSKIGTVIVYALTGTVERASKVKT